ncbi:MAG TPA: efflux RND transporter periplasmic adaptor subunit, partial [Vicinamibacterales bacterium]|nr:efflux RND transporter periplasmic adaptor subunit [Vicinamibacterales bacterium]
MAMTTRRSVGIALGVVIAAALLVVAFAFRDRLRPQPEVSGAADRPPEPPAQAGAGGDIVARGDVTIDPQRQQLIGVRLAAATRSRMATVVRTTGVVRIDETRLSDVNVKLDGWIRDLHVDFTGQAVQKGQPLFTLYSPDLLTTENEYLLALKTRDQVKDSAIADAREYADRLVDAGRQRLRLWDLPAEDIARLEETREAPEIMTFRSPVSGVVVEKQAVRGMHIVPGQTLYKVADLSVVWVEADVY